MSEAGEHFVHVDVLGCAQATLSIRVRHNHDQALALTHKSGGQLAQRSEEIRVLLPGICMHSASAALSISQRGDGAGVADAGKRYALMCHCSEHIPEDTRAGHKGSVAVTEAVLQSPLFGGCGPRPHKLAVFKLWAMTAVLTILLDLESVAKGCFPLVSVTGGATDCALHKE